MSEFQHPDQHPEGSRPAGDGSAAEPIGYTGHDGIWRWPDSGDDAAPTAPVQPPLLRDGAAHTETPFLRGDSPAKTEPLNYGSGLGYDQPASPAVDGGAARPRRLRTMLVGTAVLAALVGGGTGAATVALTDGGRTTTTASGLATSNAAAPVAAVTDGTVAAAAAKIKPSVVTIQVKGSSESGTGSGVIIRSDGYILTNDHVVSVAATGGSILVQLSDGRSASATIVGRDTTDDLAVIKVSGLSNLTAATFANSAALVAGQSVVAVGAPLGLSATVTSGIVSATARTVRSGDQNQAVFAAVQTDAAINPGNSGGALVDLNGDVIGINSAIASTGSDSQTGTQSGNIGIGFAIPSNEASRVAAELIATGKASHALLGVTVSSAQSDTATGAVINSVTPGGAAAAAGLRAGDVVTAVDGVRISEGDDLVAAIHSHAVKDTVTITYTRNGSSHTVKATLAAGTN